MLSKNPKIYKLIQLTTIETGSANVQDSNENGNYPFFDRSTLIKKTNSYSFDKLAIIYPGEGSEFYPRIFNGKFELHQRAYALFDFSDKVDPIFLFQQLLTKNLHFIKTAVGSTVKSLRMYSFESCEVKLVELSLQRKIGAFLSAIDRLIENQKEKVSRIKSLKKGYLQKMFPADGEDAPEIRLNGFKVPWLSKKLGETGTTYTGLQGKSSEDFGHGAARYITYMNVFSNTIANNKQLESVEVDGSQNEVKYGDVFFTTSSETPEEVGMTSVWLNNQPNTYLNSFCFGFRPSTKFNPHFLGYLLRSPTIREKLIFLAQGISRYNISKTRVMDISIQFPNLIEQEKIGSFLSTIDRLIEKEEATAERYESLKKGYLQKIFAD
jgi:type I restriction enzyme S subunit